jgi:RNA polymerase sigma-70 factor, ECF subfamily
VPDVTDQLLIAQVLSADPRAERALYDQHVDKVYRLAYRLSGDATMAQDVTQETFVRAFNRLAQFRGDAQLGTWICSICVSVALNGVRAAKLRGSRETDLSDAMHTVVSTRQSEPDLRERMQLAIDALPEGYRTVFLMHDLEGYTHEEIAASLGVETGTSKAQLFRARRKLRSLLADFAGEWT